MKRYWILAIIAAVGLMASPVQAADGKLYFSGSAGLSLTDDLDRTGLNISFDPGYNLGGALGFDMGEIRAEGEIRYSAADVDTVNGASFPGSADMSAFTFMGNGYYDFDLGNTPLTPYLGAGIGLVHSDFSAGAFSADETDFGYQFMAGLGYDLSSKAVLTAEYRFLGIADSDAPNTHAFLFGARFYF